MKHRQAFTRSGLSLMMMLGMHGLMPPAQAMPAPLPPLPASTTFESSQPDLCPPLPPISAENLAGVSVHEAPIHIAQTLPEKPLPAPGMPVKGKMQLEATDPITGQNFNIEISSEELTYNPETASYTVTGNVYIIIPERSTEILADKVTFNTKTSDMIATGNVFIINQERVIGSEQAQFELNRNISTYVNPRSISEYLRIQSKSAIRTNDYTILKAGRLIVEPEVVRKFQSTSRYAQQGFRLGRGAFFSYLSPQNIRKMLQSGAGGTLVTQVADSVYTLDSTVLQGDPNKPKDSIEEVPDKPISPRDVQNADFEPTDTTYRLKVKTVNIHRKEDGFDEITLKNVKLKYKGNPVMWLPFTEFGYQEDKRFITYLGPDVGFNADYGGFFAGPGWDFRFLDGWVKFSPLLTYGGGQRLVTDQGQNTDVPTQIGYGFLGHFRSHQNQTDIGWSSNIRELIMLSEQRLFNRKNTRLRVGVNQFYTNGFFSLERPAFIAEVVDTETFRPFENWLLRTYATAGVAKDEFSPTRQATYFVLPTSNEPITTTRFQLQGQMATIKPLVKIGEIGSIGAVVQGRLALYGTGDAFGILQGGPYFNLVTGPLLTTVNYYYGTTTGKTPFVFDSYYFGQNFLQVANALDLGRYLSVGVSNGFNLNQSNAKNDFLVSQQIFMNIGSKNVKFSLAYDTFQKRTFFGITINPEGGKLMMDFDTLNVYQPGIEPRFVQNQAAVLAPRPAKK